MFYSWAVTIAHFFSCLRQKQTSQKTVCRASHTQATALVDTAAARTITHNTFAVRSQGTCNRIVNLDAAKRRVFSIEN
jgi:hypothetical protein